MEEIFWGIVLFADIAQRWNLQLSFPHVLEACRGQGVQKNGCGLYRFIVSIGTDKAPIRIHWSSFAKFCQDIRQNHFGKKVLTTQDLSGNTE
jgi:hypothetical protein